MRKIRVAVIGCGVLGSRHASVYKTLPGVELAGVCDLHQDRAERLGLEVGAPAFTDLKGVREKIDAVSVCTPATTHFAVAKKFLESGTHLLIEKPITTRLDHADELLALAKSKNLILQTGHIERYNGAVRAVKKLVKNPIFIECDRIGIYDPRISDVGVVLDLMIHDIDIVLDLVPSEVRTVEAVGLSILSEKEDFANGRIVFENGAIANLTASRIAQKRLRKIRIFEPDRYISLDYFRQEAQTFTKTSASMSETLYHPIDIRKSNPLEEEITDFVASIAENRPPDARAEAGRAALSVATRILAEIQSGRKTALPR